jgi:hypothetical protein
MDCAASKSMPCLTRFAALLAGSNSNSSMYRNHTVITPAFAAPPLGGQAEEHHE